MADSGDLGKLPPEIRKEIYSYLLVEEKRIVISRYKEHKKHRPVRMGSYRNANHTVPSTIVTIESGQRRLLALTRFFLSTNS